MDFYFAGLIAWFILSFLAVINAIIREKVYAQRLGELKAHQLSTLIFSVVIFSVSLLLLRFTGSKTDTELLALGLIWLLLTLSFEFIAGHYVFGNSWKKLLADYNILKGRIWILIPITTFFAPWLASKIILFLLP